MAMKTNLRIGPRASRRTKTKQEAWLLAILAVASLLMSVIGLVGLVAGLFQGRWGHAAGCLVVFFVFWRIFKSVPFVSSREL